jgi:hypothetical protein
MAKTFNNYLAGTYALALSYLTTILSALGFSHKKILQKKPVNFTIATLSLSPCALVICGKLLENFSMTSNTSLSGVSLRIHLG